MSSDYFPAFCLDCGFGYTWCLKCLSCACGCICWDDELWQRTGLANGKEIHAATGRYIDTVELEGEYL